MPSARTWWKATISAVLSPSSPVTAVMRQSGRSAGSRVPTTSAAIFNSASSSPGAAHSTDDTWSPTSNPGASTQIGRPQPGGVGTRRWRRRGTERTRSATAARSRSASSSVPPPSTSTAPTCIGAEPTSVASDTRSSGLARSIASLLTVGSLPSDLVGTGPEPDGRSVPGPRQLEDLLEGGPVGRGERVGDEAGREAGP